MKEYVNLLKEQGLPILPKNQNPKRASKYRARFRLYITTPLSPPSQRGDFVVSLRRELRRTLSRTMKGSLPRVICHTGYGHENRMNNMKIPIQ